jgi:hypothetical protein
MVNESIDSAESVVSGVGHGFSRRGRLCRWRRRKRDVAWAEYVIMVRWN